jgi:hypothetical protein
MSDSNRDNKPRNGAKGQRNSAFNLREERPIRPEPNPLGRTRDPFDNLDVGTRSVSRSTTTVKERQPLRKPLISARPVGDDEPEDQPPPVRRAAPQRARSFAEPPAMQRAYPPSGYGAGRAGFGGMLSGPWLAALVSLACILVLYTLWSRPETIRFSNFSGRGAPAADLPQVDPASYPQLPTAPGESSVVGPPTVSAADVDAILAQYGSPAAGTGQAWVNLGIQYQIDPAYAVAFFIHESSAGTNPAWAGIKPDGSLTHNVGNIICAGYPTCFNRFRDYPNWETGIEDWYKLIAVEYINGRGAHTVEQIIPIYAPSFENNVPQYVAAVNNLVRSWRTEGVRR